MTVFPGVSASPFRPSQYSARGTFRVPRPAPGVGKPGPAQLCAWVTVERGANAAETPGTPSPGTEAIGRPEGAGARVRLPFPEGDPAPLRALQPRGVRRRPRGESARAKRCEPERLSCCKLWHQRATIYLRRSARFN
ncbi:hypothetical protein AAFF_G00351710 [Aldrovandia affinis]|uniref:Uncharacterized protein n=1 Tax=Aldrovandia affinis TaxID=143900 RepID=A0AAD7SIS6_9TELE|nr:hypothetical protein AAFF_G00351710 [Aldrovandia affinis]